MKLGWSLIAVALFAAPASAQSSINVDGRRDVAYGGPLAVQTVQTGFGDNASELNAGYGKIRDHRLYLLATGNIEANFNKLEIFIDSKAGGQSVFTSAGNDNSSAMNGLVFDAGFGADYHLIVRRGNNIGNDVFDLDFADLSTGVATGYLDILGGLTGFGTTGTGVNAFPIAVAYDNSNVAGVGGAAPNVANQAAAAAVTTGLELGIALSDLGYDGGPILVMIGQNNPDHNYWSNQFLGGLPAPAGNLGGDEMGGFTGEGAIDMTHFAGNQFFRVKSLPGDFDEDGDVDVTDYLTLATHLHTNVAALTLAQTYEMGDLTADRRIDGNDFAGFQFAFDAANGVGAFVALQVAAPEPSAGLLAAVAGVTIAIRRRGARGNIVSRPIAGGNLGPGGHSGNLKGWPMGQAAFLDTHDGRSYTSDNARNAARP